MTPPIRLAPPSSSRQPPSSILVLLLIALALLPTPLPAADLKEHRSNHHLIHTDLPPAEAREAQIRMNRMAQEYLRRTEGFSGKLSERLPFYLYSTESDYLKAGGVKGSAGVYNGERLMAVVLRHSDGAISLATWNIIQHEGFHQFAHAVIGGEMPMWADEGLAEYFGEAIFTGDGFVSGIIPRARLTRLKALLEAKKHKPLAQFLALSRDQWNQSIEIPNYDQAWSLVHFLAHADGGKFQEKFVRFMNEIGKGEAPAKAFARTVNTIPNLEITWRNWWLNQPANPSADLYAQAVLAMATSFHARAAAQGQTFPTFEQFIATPHERLKCNEEDWLPPSLWTIAQIEIAKLKEAGAVFQMDKEGLTLALANGAKLSGRFELKAGRVATTTVIQTGKL